MVQQVPGGNPLQPGAYYPPREPNWARNDRNAYLDPHEVPQSNSSSMHQYETVERALNNYAKVGAKKFALIILKENGEELTYLSKHMRPDSKHIFSDDFRQQFRRSVQRSETREQHDNSFSSDAGMYSEFESDPRHGGRKYSSAGSSSEMGRRQQRKTRSEESDGDGSRSAKRHRRGQAQYRDSSNDDTPVPVVQKQPLAIGDSAEVKKYYEVRFKDMQQSACKVMGKAFVKLVEPKKQTHHPYTKGNDKAPPWWPETTGQDGVRHREPDHLLKPERIRLLVHILRMVVEPKENQHATVRKLGLKVKDLEIATMEAMSNWFADKDHPENELKRPFLREIFKVAKHEERFKNGEIDGTTKITVSFGESIGVDEESDGDAERDMKDEEDDTNTNSVHMPTPPDSLVSPSSMSQNHQFHQLEESNMQRMRPANIPLRQYPSPMESMPFEDQSFRAMGYQQPHSPNTVDPNRRNFISAGYPTQQPLYSWPNPMATSGPSASFYTTSPQTASSTYNLPPPIPQQPPMASSLHSFSDGFPNRYDPAPGIGNQLRTGSLGHTTHHMVPPHGGFQEYHGSENVSFGHQTELKEDHHHGTLHHQ